MEKSLILKQILGMRILLNSYSKFTLSTYKKYLTKLEIHVITSSVQHF